jgi:hypothetical protein
VSHSTRPGLRDSQCEMDGNPRDAQENGLEGAEAHEAILPQLRSLPEACCVGLFD